ncbi:MAG: hypothetical protein R3E76_10660 [Planctomycetota bacterium]
MVNPASPVARNARRGSILGMAVLFFVMVAVAGAALLSMSTITRLKTVRSGADVRLLIAAEAGMETIRGRFTLVAGVQDDWSWLTTGTWTTLSTVSVNGTPVTLQANLLSGNSVPSARIRGIATASGRTRAVEQTIKVASFSDYALYSGSTGDAPIGANFNMVGTFYSRGNINLLGNTGIRFFGDASTSGIVTNYPGTETQADIFKADLDINSPVIDVPPAAFGSAPIKTRAQELNTAYAGSSSFPNWNVPASGFLFYRNTVSLTFNSFSSGGVNGTQVVRTFYRRNSGTNNGYTDTQYSLASETITLPQNEEICLYIDTDQAPTGTDSYSAGQRNYYPATSQVNISGTIRNARITVYAEKDVHIVNNVSYYSLLNDPTLREPANKQSANALGFKEMLGICAEDEVRFDFGSFSPLTSGSFGWNTSGNTNQYTLDAVFLGTYRAYINTTPPTGYSSSELWVCGGLINTAYNNTGFGGSFNPRHYDWDWRLQSTTPPFFLRAYNVTATFVPGTWRTYEL